MTDELGALANINHIVVVMMENRSFDHMLGYLKQYGMDDVEGLTGAEYNLDRDGNKVPVHAFDADASTIQRAGEPLQKRLDPDHSKGGVRTQLGTGYGDFAMGGFVKAFVESRKPEDNVGPELWNLPMGYYTKKDLPVYDFLARNFCVCDAWHSSVPGDTWPNRLYAMAGRESDRVHPSLLEHLKDLIPGHLFARLQGAPIYDVAAFTRHLDDSQWRWYSHDPATLRAADGHYRKLEPLNRDNFAYYDRRKVSPLTGLAESPIVAHDSFLDDVAKGELRAVSWIDPNFIDLSVLETNSNDDHPPTDIRAGQALILEIYEALRRSPIWNETLLVVVYDEHGGFYDHVPPPVIHDDSGYETLGVRVPALLVGPRVGRQVCKQVFEHTTLIKTILARFASDTASALSEMGGRIPDAPDLGLALQDEVRDDIPEAEQAAAVIDEWRTAARRVRQGVAAGPSPAPDGAGQPVRLHEFQEEFMKYALAMRHLLPPGQP